MGISTQMKVHQCRENEAHAYSAATSALHSAHIFPPLLCRCDLADSKSKERCMKSLLCFQCFYGKCAVGFLHICMCYIGARPTRIVVKNSSFYFKIYLDGWLWSALIFKRFFAPFRLPYSGISQKNRSYRNCGHEKMA